MMNSADDASILLVDETSSGSKENDIEVPNKTEEKGNEVDNEEESRISELDVLGKSDQDLDQALKELEMILERWERVVEKAL